MNNEILKKFNRIKRFKLIASIIIDIIGVVTYVLPVIGEGGDLVWAPLSACLIFMLYPNRKRNAIAALIEEGLPFTDFIPTAYLAWRREYVKEKNKTLHNYISSQVEEQQIIQDVMYSKTSKTKELTE